MSENILDMTATIVAAQARNNSVEPDQLPELITSVFRALSNAAKPEPASVAKEPAVPVKKSVSQDHIVCLECGKNFKTLKGHLKAHHQLTIGEYRQRFGLPGAYPIIAPEYAERRSAIAKQTRLGKINRE